MSEGTEFGLRYGEMEMPRKNRGIFFGKMKHRMNIVKLWITCGLLIWHKRLSAIIGDVIN